MQQANHQQQLEQLYRTELNSIMYPPETVRGIIFAVCSAPEIPMPEQWLVWVFEQRGQLDSVQQADKLTAILMAMLQQQLAQMRDGKISLPGHYTLDWDSTAQSDCELFMQGVTMGHGHLQQIWQTCWQQLADKAPDKLPKMQKDLKHCLLMFSTFANIKLALDQAQDRGNELLLSKLDSIFLQLPDALQTYVDLAGQLASYLPEQFESFEQPLN